MYDDTSPIPPGFDVKEVDRTVVVACAVRYSVIDHMHMFSYQRHLAAACSYILSFLIRRNSQGRSNGWLHGVKAQSLVHATETNIDSWV